MVFRICLILGKVIIFLLKLRGQRGTALPGLVIEKIYPDFLKKAQASIDTVIVVSGTNGKTSTQTVLSNSLRDLYQENILVNSRGANLKRGLISLILKKYKIWGRNSYKYAVFEVEEATLPKIIKDINPQYFIITNFFRDQLDAYGEIERTKEHILNAIKLAPDMKIIANGDDPHVVDLMSQVDNRKTFAKIDGHEKYINYEYIDGGYEHIVGSSSEKNTGKGLKDMVMIPEPEILSDLSTRFIVNKQKFNLYLPGFYSVYAFAFAYVTLGMIDPDISNRLSELSRSVAEIQPAFGRGEKLIHTDLADDTLQIFLIKNPIGFDLTLDTLGIIGEQINLVILINDKTADGRDVSWLWDSQIEKLKNLNLDAIYLGGSRALDMQVRVKYALPQAFNQRTTSKTSTHQEDNYGDQFTTTYSDYQSLLDALVKDKATNIKVVATYTAMNEFRDHVIGKARSRF